ncbi:VOC family protein [Microbacterium fluvii]|uniref:VOC family protein n=1 Tax=Microbacterium fluvii TaxID=415215 RepID=A0ABW2HFK6_9MICO|nr:VOC family protein [Microbacterium fluvii]MCU4673675.1 hypothetical protein [Microbacterium fluvii]
MHDRANASGTISPAQFHRADGVADWRITSTGPQAVFTADSLGLAASLVAPIVDAAAKTGILPDIDVRPEAVIVRIPIEEEAIAEGATAFAAAVSSAAAELGLSPDPSRVQAVQVYVAQHSKADVRPFFLAALGYDPLGEGDGVDPLRRGPQLAFNPITGDAPGRGRTHLDIYVPADQAQARVDAALAAGGRLVDDENAPAWWSLASPENHGIDIASWPDTYG